MRPLSWIAAGFILVVVDMRIQSLDIGPDPAGWLLIAWGARKVARPAVVWLAVVTAAVSVVDISLPSRWAPVDPRTGEVLADRDNTQGFPEVFVFERVEDARLALLCLAFLLTAVVTLLLLGDLRKRAEAYGRRGAARDLGFLQGLVPGLWTGPYVLGSAAALFAGGSFDPVWNGAMELVAIAGLAPMVWLTALVIRERDHTWAVAPTPTPSPTTPTAGLDAQT